MNGFKSSKINENALTKCNKCDCLILSDSSDSKNDQCINPYKLNYSDKDENYLSSVDPESDCQNVKIIVKNGDSSTDKSISDSECCPCESDGGSLKTNFSMKHVCFGFCRKKKNKDAPSTDPTKEQDGYNQTSTPAIPEKKDDKVQTISEPNINDIIKKCCCTCKSPGGGGCNTNTIIFPREKVDGGALTNLEDCIKAEAKANTKAFEEVLNELYKQRREIREVRDLLDLMVRTMREHYCTGAPTNQKSYQEVFEDICKRTCLERKSNSLSIVKSNNKTDPTEVAEAATDEAPSEEIPKKKKGLFSCFG